MALRKKQQAVNSIRFSSRKAATTSGSFKSFKNMGERPIVVKGKGGISKEEKEIRKQFPSTTPKKGDPFKFRIVLLGKKKKPSLLSKLLKTKTKRKRRTKRKKR